jgi:hypothetical protein
LESARWCVMGTVGMHLRARRLAYNYPAPSGRCTPPPSNQTLKLRRTATSKRHEHNRVNMRSTRPRRQTTPTRQFCRRRRLLLALAHCFVQHNPSGCGVMQREAVWVHNQVSHSSVSQPLPTQPVHCLLKSDTKLTSPARQGRTQAYNLAFSPIQYRLSSLQPSVSDRRFATQP